MSNVIEDYKKINLQKTALTLIFPDGKVISINKIKGTHNFKSFTSDNEKDNYIRTVNIKFKEKDNCLYLYVSSTGFLRYMVRNIVGLLLDIQDGKKSVIDIDKIFESESRISNGACAPAHALYLNKVKY